MIKLEHISKTFGDTGDGVHAVKDVSLEIGDGEIFGIIGFSGAGKSTLVRCINLLERPTSGTVTVDGQELTALSEKELPQARKKISMIFQGFNLLMQRTCLKNVCFPMELSGVPKAQAVRSSGWPSPGRWPRTRRCFSAMRPPPLWTPPPPIPSSRF